MPTIHYRAVFSESEGQLSVLFPDLPGCISQGEGPEEAITYAEDALSSHLAVLAEQGEVLPQPSRIGDPLPDWLVEDLEGDAYFESLVRAELPGKTVRVNITMPENVLARIDSAAKRQGTTRSGFLVQAAQAAMADA